MILTNRQIRIKLFESLRNSFFKKTVAIAFGLLFILLLTAFSLIVTRFHYKLELNQQKDLMEQLKGFAPLMEQAGDMLDKLGGMDNLQGLMGKLGGLNGLTGSKKNK